MKKARGPRRAEHCPRLDPLAVPALRAGMVVLADRYIYTLMVRDMVRGAHIEWLEPLYSMAIVPDGVFVLDTAPQNILERTLGFQMPDVRLGDLWPILLIVLGGVVLFRAARDRA